MKPRNRRRRKVKSKAKKTEMNSAEFVLFLKKIALIVGSFLIFGFFSLVLTQEIPKTKSPLLVQQTTTMIPPLVDHQIKERVAILPTMHYRSKPQKHLNYASTLQLMHKADGDILYLKSRKLRITFKANKLIASKKELFKETQRDPYTLYCTLRGVDSELNGQIIDKLTKQSFADSITIKQNHQKLTLKIQIKESCIYKRSVWAKKSGLDLLTFKCEELY